MKREEEGEGFQSSPSFSEVMLKDLLYTNEFYPNFVDDAKTVIPLGKVSIFFSGVEFRILRNLCLKFLLWLISHELLCSF
jgi:hypothetical protein